MRTLLIASLLLVGCATFQNTPQQDYVYDMARPCEGNGARIAQVLPNGDFSGSWTGGAYTWPEFQQCIREQASRHPYEAWKKKNNR